MNNIVSKETRLNIRVKPAFKEDLKMIADYYGLTVSSYVHSALVKMLREEKERVPQAFIPENGEPVAKTAKKPIPYGNEEKGKEEKIA